MIIKFSSDHLLINNEHKKHFLAILSSPPYHPQDWRLITFMKFVSLHYTHFLIALRCLLLHLLLFFSVRNLIIEIDFFSFFSTIFLVVFVLYSNFAPKFFHNDKRIFHPKNSIKHILILFLPSPSKQNFPFFVFFSVKSLKFLNLTTTREGKFKQIKRKRFYQFSFALWRCLWFFFCFI